MSDLVDKLREAIANDLRIARACISPGPWTARGDCRTEVVVVDADGAVVADDSGWTGLDRTDADHMARQGPDRAIRQAETFLELIDIILTYEAKIDGEWGCCHNAERIGRGECPDTKPEEIDGLVALAKVYEIEVDQ
jgi:hypothetical protein